MIAIAFELGEIVLLAVLVILVLWITTRPLEAERHDPPRIRKDKP